MYWIFFAEQCKLCFFDIPLVVVVEASVLGLHLGDLKICVNILWDGRNTWVASTFVEVFEQINKKVLLRERKRYTARHISSIPSAVLSQEGGGTPPLDRRVPHPWPGYPLSWPGWGTPLSGVLPGPGQGNPPPRLDLAMYPPPPGVNRLKTLPSPSFGCGR